jgi:4-diphosphocytidyl-2-C-methyl-D-erythritol kinase
MPQLTEIAYAKINLALHVRRRRDDGYHELETLFAFADRGDLLSAEHADILSLSVSGTFGDGISTGEDNLVLRAAAALQGAVGTQKGAKLHLAKALPIASGIGGGSSDAAATIRLLERLWGVDIGVQQRHNIAESLGADVPACLASTTVAGTGTGASLVTVELDGISGTPVLLVNPNASCPTGPIFEGWDGIDRGALEFGNWRQARNDLQPLANRHIPEIYQILDILRSMPGANFARMSGSGATCFALFDSDEACEDAQSMMATHYPYWWTMAAHLR